MQDIKIDIVIPIHNAFYFFENCLHSIFCCDADLIGKIIVSDDHSTEEGIEEIIKKYNKNDNIILTKPTERSYFSANVNHGFNFVSEKYFIMLSSDTRAISYDWLKVLINEYESDENIGIVAPCYPEYLNPQPVSRYSKDLSFVSPPAWCIKTDLFKEMNGLRSDGRCIHWNSDYEFCERIINRGLKIVQVPTFVCHWGGRSKEFVSQEIWNTR